MRSSIVWRNGTVLVWAVVGTLLLGLTGCGSKEPYSKTKVNGKITYDDGSLIQGKKVILKFNPLAAPIDKKTYPRPGSAAVNPTDGTFAEATTYDFGDGLILGKHKVSAFIEDDKRQRTELAITPEEIEVGKDTHFEFKAKKTK